MGGYWLGIDLGTTFTAVAVARDGRAEIVSLGHHAAAIPSLVFLREDGTWLVGDPAGRRGLVEPGRLAREFKRRFGDPTAILLGGAPWSADALTSQLLRHVVAEAVAQEGSPPEGVAVTYPANWGPYKTDLLRQAVRTAGLPGRVEPVLLTEPEAAARHYAATERVEPGEMVAIYDLGGGTFDATVVAKTGTGFTLVGEPEGIERLGGIDFDEAVLAHVASFLGPALADLDPDDPTALAAMARLRADCTAAKEALSADTEVSIPVLLPTVQTEIRLTRGEFEAMIRPTLTDTISALERSIRSTGAAPDAVKAVLLVGGSSRIPLVGQLVAAAIGRPVAVDVHPKHAVALGAAVAAVAAAAAGDPATVAPASPPAPSTPASPAPPAPEAPAPAPSPPSERPPRTRSRRPLVIGAAAAVTVAIVIAVALLAGGDKEKTVLPPEVPTFDLGFYPQSIAPADGAVWLDAGDATAARFGVPEGRLTASVKVGSGDGRVAVAAGAGAVWVADIKAGTLSRIEPASNAVTATFDIGRTPHSVIVAAGAVWVSLEDDGVVARVDPATRAVTRVQVRGRPTYLAYGGGILWVTDQANSNLARIDTATNTVLGSAESGGCPGWLAADDTTVWVQDECKVSTVFQVDPSSGKVVGTATVGKNAKGLALASGSLWVANATDGTVSQVDVRSRQVQRTVRVGPSPEDIAADAGSIWVANTGNSTLSRIAR